MKRRTRRLICSFIALSGLGSWLILNPQSYEQIITPDSTEVVASDTASVSHENPTNNEIPTDTPTALSILAKIEVKGRAPKTGYSREEFYHSWPLIDGCNLRQRILKRDLGDSAVIDNNDHCSVIAGEFDEPYTGKHLIFTEKSELSKSLQIDHIVALSDAWQKGAQYWDADKRYQLATDPLNLISADSSANQQKSDGDAATWLPSNKPFRCAYVARQVSVKYKYGLWMTSAEKTAIENVLQNCPNEPLLN